MTSSARIRTSNLPNSLTSFLSSATSSRMGPSLSSVDMESHGPGQSDHGLCELKQTCLPVGYIGKFENQVAPGHESHDNHLLRLDAHKCELTKPEGNRRYRSRAEKREAIEPRS